MVPYCINFLLIYFSTLPLVDQPNIDANGKKCVDFHKAAELAFCLQPPTKIDALLGPSHVRKETEVLRGRDEHLAEGIIIVSFVTS